MDDLTTLALQHGTDKWGWHTYTPLYYDLLHDRRSDIRHLLELGILHGASLTMWRDFFPHAHIHGADISPPPHDLGPRISMHKVDLANFRTYGALIERQYDLIIDDASHQPEHQLLSLSLLWPTLTAKGYYIIEDVIELASWTHMLIPMYGPIRVYDRRGPHNTIDDVLMVFHKI